ncbi:contact-dependent growth inhibition system immunity protein [Amycolatopsis magusensis]|uniref:contact-dependent growth inhibition system immunity protein n=1 Tax=Amycolatopsis magusensis TaxID=882444 RepID=UPI0037A08434
MEEPWTPPLRSAEHTRSSRPKAATGATSPLTRLERDPLAEGDFYVGDLLTAVLRIPRYYWRQHPDQLRRVSSVLENLSDLDEHGSLRQQIEAFRGSELGQ